MPVGQPSQQRRDVLAVRRRGIAASGSVSSSAARPRSVAAIAGESSATWRASASTLGSSRLTSSTRLGIDRTWTAGRGSTSRRRRRRTCRPRRPAAMPSSSPAGPAPHPEHRVHDRLVGHPEPVQQHGDGVHQHRRVVGDDLQRGAEAAGSSAVDRDECLAGLSLSAQAVVRRPAGAADISLPAADMSTGPVTRRRRRARRRGVRGRSRCTPWRVLRGWPGGDASVRSARSMRPRIDRHAARS